jgi:vacuolar-type H+-ATPase subunit H
MTFNDDLPTAGEASGQHPQATPRRSRDPLAGPEADALLRRAADLVASARPMPLSSSVMINRDEVLDLLGEAIDRLPDELRQARWLLKEREDFLKRVQGEGDEILDQASAKAEAMVQRTEVVKAAEQRAKRIVEEANDEARRLRHECEDFCDQRLAQFEIVLNRTLKMVHAGREKLNASPMSAPASAEELDEPISEPVPIVPDDVPPGGFGRPPSAAGPSPVGAGRTPTDNTGFFDQDEG